MLHKLEALLLESPPINSFLGSGCDWEMPDYEDLTDFLPDHVYQLQTMKAVHAYGPGNTLQYKQNKLSRQIYLISSQMPAEIYSRDWRKMVQKLQAIQQNAELLQRSLMLDAIAREYVVGHDLLAESVRWRTSRNYSCLGGELELSDVFTDDSATAVDSDNDSVYDGADVDALFEFVD